MQNQKQPPDVFYKKAVLENLVKFTWKHLYWIYFSEACNSIKLESPTRVFSGWILQNF